MFPQESEQVVIFGRRKPRALHQREKKKQLAVLESAAEHELTDSILVEKPRNAVGCPVRLFHQWNIHPAQI